MSDAFFKTRVTINVLVAMQTIRVRFLVSVHLRVCSMDDIAAETTISMNNEGFRRALRTDE